VKSNEHCDVLCQLPRVVLAMHLITHQCDQCDTIYYYTCTQCFIKRGRRYLFVENKPAGVN